MARSREADRTYQPRYQYGIRKPSSVDQPTTEYQTIPAAFLGLRRMHHNSVIPMKNRIYAAIQRYRNQYG